MFGFHERKDKAVITPQVHRIGKNSEVFEIGDAIQEDSGFALASANSDRIVGFAAETITMAADNETVAKYEIAMLPAYQGVEYECDLDAATTQAASVGFYAVLTGATGAMQLSQSSLSATAGQFRITKLDPRGELSDTRVLCTPVFTAYSHTTAS